MERIAPQWIVENLEHTLGFYKNELDFDIDWKGSLFSIISKGNVSIMLRQLEKEKLKRPNRIPFNEAGWHSKAKEAWDAYIWVSEVDQFYNLIKKRNVQIIKQLQNTDYGNRDFEIEDINEYIICFGERLK